IVLLHLAEDPAQQRPHPLEHAAWSTRIVLGRLQNLSFGETRLHLAGTSPSGPPTRDRGALCRRSTPSHAAGRGLGPPDAPRRGREAGGGRLLVLPAAPGFPASVLWPPPSTSVSLRPAGGM